MYDGNYRAALDLKLEVIEQARDMLAASAASVEVESDHWIGGADDQSEDYCYDCASDAVARQTVESQPGAELFVDGGWRSTSDAPKACVCCGVRLNYAPTEYCTDEEIGHFLDYWNDDISPGEALDLVNIFDAVDTNPLEHQDWYQKDRLADAVRRVEEAFILAERVISAVVFCTSQTTP
ncbi:hypothetical protein [Azospirillum rugosum]|uniref:Uncharacterized protein n=1 Tax=Azospirillum rugosum TaxID=416170 RepID=A0ABS4SF92_9PROT|nr:hypothetical protein [Azospirillum rugosum]MBP2290738.1 hypothetical protein [Azospirillum rugosum]MDQ0525627.1 hypothetical protein [Azospirillum rugosum]